MTAIGVPAPVRLEGLRPTPQDLVDLGFAFALAGIGVIGFRTVFSGHEELTVGLPAVVLGVILGHVLVRRRVPLLVGATIGTAVFFLFGGALALRNEAIGGVLPSPNVLVRPW